MSDTTHDGSQRPLPKACSRCCIPLLPANNFTVLECPKCGYFEPVVLAGPLPEYTPEPWIWRDVVGAGIQISATLPEGFKFDATCHGANGATWFMVFTMHETANISISSERWVQFETKAWQEMQKANAQRIVACVNACAGMQDPAAEIAALKADLTETITFRNELEEAYHHLLAETKQLRTNKKTLVDALKQAIEGMADMIDYVPGYFRKKWKHDDCITEAREALNKIKESE